MRTIGAAGALLLAVSGCWEETERLSKEEGAKTKTETDAGEREQGLDATADGDDREPARAAMDAGQPADKASRDAGTAKQPAKPKAEPSSSSTSNMSSMQASSTASRHSDDDAGATTTQGEQGEQGEQPEQATLVGLGQSLFQDRSLSLTGTQSCASCHVAEDAFTGSADHDNPRFPVSKGATGQVFGTRNSPTAMYAEFSPAFEFVQEPEAPNEYTPTGGLFWDGRASSLSEQAAAPFVNPREMALPDKQAVIARVQKAKYAGMFEPLFGPDPLSNVEQAYQHVTDAIAAFERTTLFHPFSSKFDAYLRGQAQLSEQEQYGFDLFKDPEKGNCIACHVGKLDSHQPEDWLFTDFTYDNLGVPRNMQIADNADPKYFDLGLCQAPAVMDKIPAVIEDKAAFLASLCGAFKVPTLRNTAKTAPYMHNGYFAQLRDVVDFYVTRDTDPARWYPRTEDGTIQKLNDLPELYWGNVNTEEVPYDRKPGQEPRLSSDEINAVVVFLETLSDGYTP